MPQFLNLKKGIIKMPRSKNKVAAHKRKKNILKQAKGYVGARSKLYTVAKNAVEKGLTHSYRDRKLKKESLQKSLDSSYQCRSKD